MTEQQRRSRKRKRGRRHIGKNISGEVALTNNESSSVTASSGSASPIKSGSKSSSSFLDKMKARLSGGYFRMINEKLYTCSGDEALQYFKEDPSLFNVEANRVLKPHGWLLIAEVKSRFDPNTGGADPNKFVTAICELGFTSTSKDLSNKMFILFYFQKKEKQKSKDIKWPKLKPCLYKRR